MILSFTWYDRKRPEKFIELTDLLPESHDIVRLSKSAYVESWRLRQIVAGKAAEAWGVSPNNTGGGGGWVTPAKQSDLSKLPDVKRAIMRFVVEQRDPSTPWKERLIRVELHSEAAGEAEGKLPENSASHPWK